MSKWLKTKTPKRPWQCMRCGNIYDSLDPYPSAYVTNEDREWVKVVCRQCLPVKRFSREDYESK